MKTILTIFTSLVLAAGMAQAAIITNGNFNSLSGWDYTTWGGAGYDANVSRTADGSGSLWIKNSGYGEAYQTFSVAANTEYDLSLWVQGPADTYIRGIISLQNGDGYEYYRAEGYITPATGAWSNYGGSFNSGNYTTLTLYIDRYNLTDGTTFWADDVAVTQVPEPVSLGLLAVGGLLVLRRRR
jgi:hypothetical protein